MTMNNDILLRRRNMLMVDVKENLLDITTEEGKVEQTKRDVAVASIVKNITSFGFLPNLEMVEKLRNTDYKNIVSWYLDIKPVLIDVIGLREHMEPLYKNFPEEVMSTDGAEMYIASLIYLLSHNTISPSEAKARPELDEFCNLIHIEVANQEAFDSIFTNLLSSKVSFGEADVSDVAFYIEHDERFGDKLPETIPNKENLVSLTNMVIDRFGYEDYRTQSLTNVYKTATDVLRLATAMSKGDVSLKNKTTYKHFNKAERRFLLSLLDSCKYPVEDMLRYKNNWILLGEILHPGDYAKRYSNAFDAFNKIRSGAKIKTWGGKVDEAFEKHNLTSLLKLLSARPGEFCRRLDRTLSSFNTEQENNTILDAFEKVADTVETTVLIGLMEHMFDRQDKSDSRIFFPKGRIAKAFFIENTQKELDSKIIDRTVDICKTALVSAYSKKESMGKVYLDENLKNFKFPMVLRNANRTLRPMARGSKMELKDNCTTARVFLYWKETENSYPVDLDLSVILLDDDYKIVGTCYYGNLDERKVKNSGCYHSGDVREAPEGAAEYIDLDLDALTKFGAKNVLVCVHSFTSQPFSELAEAFVGVMEREKPNDGQIFEPMTVVNKSDLVTEQKTSLAMMLNVDTRSITWLDLGCDFHHMDDVVYNINSSKGIVVPMAKSFTQKNLISVYDLIALNVQARGEFVTDKADADYIFSMEGYVAPEPEEDIEDVVTEEPVETESENTETDVEVETEEIVEPPKHILVTPYDIDVLIGNYL